MSTSFSKILAAARRSTRDPVRGGALTQERFAELVAKRAESSGYPTAATVSNWENGRARPRQNERGIVVAIAAILLECEGLDSFGAANELLRLGGYAPLFNQERADIALSQNEASNLVSTTTSLPFDASSHTQHISDNARVDVAIAGNVDHLHVYAEVTRPQPCIDYEDWRTKQNQWLDHCFCSASEAQAHFGQPLGVAADNAGLVERSAAWQWFTSWANTWKEDHQFGVVLGEEGDGKTWSAASWLERRIVQIPDFPAVLFLSAAEIVANDPFEIVVQSVAARYPKFDFDQVKKCAHEWIENTSVDTIQFLFVLDGINERYNPEWWRKLFDGLNGKCWFSRAAVLITCRTQNWNEHFRSLQSIKANTYIVPPYNDSELDVALAVHQLHRSELQGDLLPLARRPRFLSLLIKYRQRIAESGDVTVARLIYEDWRDRYEHKRHFLLNDNQFQNLLRDLVSKYLEGDRVIRLQQLHTMLPSMDPQVVEELRTSGVLCERRGQFEVQEAQLILGFGLSLVEQVEDAVHEGRNVRETIAGWFEPHTVIDIKAQICEAAALRAIHIENLPTSAKAALLLAWVTNQNISLYTETNIQAYFPVARQSYFELTELIWSDAIDHVWAQRVLMQTFLRWFVAEQESHMSVWQRQCERWLGFVHRSYYPYLDQKTDEDAQRIQQETNERLGYELQLGSFGFAGHRLTAIDDDGLIRLGRAALALISHVPREPYMRALGIGCVAEAIMNHPGKYDEFAWIIRTSQRPLWLLVKGEVEYLLNANNRIAHQAVYRLLSYVGNGEARQLQETLSNNLFPLSEITKHHLEDPCVSGFSWQREDCERCVAREDLKSDWLARQIKPYCIDPFLPVPADIGARLAPLAATIDVHEMYTVFANTSADFAYSNYEPSLCAYAPEAIGDVVRCLIRDITVREGMALQQLSRGLHKHSLLFTQVEQESIVQAWQRLQARTQTKTEVEAEMFLFPYVLQQLDGQAQISHLLNRPEHAHDLLGFEQYFKQISIWQDIWQYLTLASSTTAITRLLWFIAKQAAAIPHEDVDTNILPLTQHKDSFVRAMFFRVIFGCTSEKSLNAIIYCMWTWDVSHHDQENHWASLILADHGAALPIAAVVRRIHPVDIGYAVHQRGNKTEEVRAYADLLHTYWRTIGVEAAEIPADLPAMYLDDSLDAPDVTSVDRREVVDHQNKHSVRSTAKAGSWGGDIGVNLEDIQRIMSDDFERHQQERLTRIDAVVRQQVAAGNYWFTRRFLPYALDEVVQARPDLVEQWVMSVLPPRADARHRLRAGSTFYEALCHTLLQTHPEQGIALYQQLHGTPAPIVTQSRYSDICLLDHALFRAPAIAAVQQAWQQRIAYATTDQELLEMVVTVQSEQAQEWLWLYIERLLQSTVPLDYMRGLTLLGFVDSDAWSERLIGLQHQVPDTWVRVLVNTSFHRWQRNRWAKHWFQRFLTVEDDQNAWAAFRLLLRCVDRRFWRWQPLITEQIGRDTIPLTRLNFVMFNEEQIKKSIKVNEEDLQTHFLGQKVMQGDLWPWMEQEFTT